MFFIGLVGLAIFLFVSITRFLKDKTKNDQELLRKMDELIKVMSREQQHFGGDDKERICRCGFGNFR
ncbi:MAG TPA: hypothetical protein DEF42_19115 [Desulfosporosinus sp.]|nr:hypothetical protein [Desulfosporosinus sp.]